MVFKFTYSTILRIHSDDNNKLSTAVALRNNALLEVKEGFTSVKIPFANLNEWVNKYPNATHITVGDGEKELLEKYLSVPSPVITNSDVSGSTVMDVSDPTALDVSGSVVLDVSGSVVLDVSGSKASVVGNSVDEATSSKWSGCCSSVKTAPVSSNQDISGANVAPTTDVSGAPLNESESVVLKRVPTATDMSAESNKSAVVIRNPVEVSTTKRWWCF